MGWRADSPSARIMMGAGLGIIALVLIVSAWLEEDVLRWYAGMLTLLAGGLFLYLGLRFRPLPAVEDELAPPKFSVREEASTRPPLLGELLVHKYRRISSDILGRALELQRGTTTPLGEILLNMGEIDRNDLDLALSDQERYKDGSWVNEPWAMRRFEVQGFIAIGAKPSRGKGGRPSPV